MRGTIRPRGKGRWQVQVYVGRHPTTGRRRFRARTVEGTRRDAERALTRLLAEVDAGRVGHGDHLTVEALIDRWIAQREHDWSPKTTRETRRITTNHALPSLATTKVERLRPADLDALYRRLLAEGVGRSTIETLHRRLHAALAQAVRWDLIATNPAERASPPRPGRPRSQAATPKQVARALANIDDPMLATFVRLAAVTGRRRGELAALRWDDVDLEVGTVLVERAVVDGGGGLTIKDLKADRPRRHALDAGTVEALRRWRKHHAVAGLAEGEGYTPWVFPSPTDRRSCVRPDYLTKAWGRLGTGLRLHDLRHGVGTAGMEAGFSPAQVADRLGHSRPSTTSDIYGHASLAGDRALAEVLGAALDAAMGT